MTIQKPQHLNPNDTIAIISPSYPLMPEFRKYYEIGKQELINMGFRIKEGKTNNLVRWWSGGTPEQQAEEINLMFSDPEVKAIVAQNGGHSALGVLPHIDFNIIKNNPKPFVGMSDISVYHLAFLKESSIVGFHMDLVTYGLGWQWSVNNKKQEYLDLFNNILCRPEPIGKIQPKTQWECVREGQAEGILIGGNLNNMSCLMGTKYFPTGFFKNALFFWEADSSTLARISRQLYQFKIAGLFDHIKGMIIGKISRINPVGYGIAEPALKELVLDIFKDDNFPILGNVDFGHETPNIPMPVGIKAEIDPKNLSFELTESATR